MPSEERRPHLACKGVGSAHKWSVRLQLGSMAEFREGENGKSNYFLSYLISGGLVSL